MAIEINNKLPTAEINQHAQHTASQKEAVATAGANPLTDSVNLSIEDAINSLQYTPSPPIDAKGIAKLQSDIANGSYQVDTNRLAEKMISFENGFPNLFNK